VIARNRDVIGAIRLALVGAANDRAAVAVILALLEYAAPTEETHTAPPVLLVMAIRESRGTLRLAVAPAEEPA
jgi:hypothetical protein